MKNNLFLILLLFSLFSACTNDSSIQKKETIKGQQVKLTADPFNDYWYSGKAELSSYTLEQARYGEMREGEAVLVFVTEDFSKKKQVKLDNTSANPSDALPVLKLNTTRKFSTGLYPYSMMTSVFTPIDIDKHPHSLKTTTSVQEWCGHTFEQLNLQSNNYQHTLHSYFESEGEQQNKIAKAFLEDEFFNLIRLNPAALPSGSIDIIPSGFFLRFKHLKTKTYKATASLSENKSDNSLQQYTVNYPVLNRTLQINFSKDFPYQIISWEDTYKDGFGMGGKELTTKATLKKKIQLAYWNKNSNADDGLRAELDLLSQ